MSTLKVEHLGTGVQAMVAEIEHKMRGARPGDYVAALIDFDYLTSLIERALDAHTQGKTIEIKVRFERYGLGLRGQMKTLRVKPFASEAGK